MIRQFKKASVATIISKIMFNTSEIEFNTKKRLLCLDLYFLIITADGINSRRERQTICLLSENWGIWITTFIETKNST